MSEKSLSLLEKATKIANAEIEIGREYRYDIIEDVVNKLSSKYTCSKDGDINVCGTLPSNSPKKQNNNSVSIDESSSPHAVTSPEGEIKVYGVSIYSEIVCDEGELFLKLLQLENDNPYYMLFVLETTNKEHLDKVGKPYYPYHFTSLEQAVSLLVKEFDFIEIYDTDSMNILIIEGEHGDDNEEE